jgi:hypothetical protein
MASVVKSPWSLRDDPRASGTISGASGTNVIFKEERYYVRYL